MAIIDYSKVWPFANNKADATRVKKTTANGFNVIAYGFERLP